MEFNEIVVMAKDFLFWLWAQWQTQTLFYLIMGNFVVAIAVGLATGEFRLGKIAEVLYKKIIPWLAVYGFFSFSGDALGMAWISNTAFGLITAKLGADLLDSLSQLGIVKERVRAAAVFSRIPKQLTK